MAIILVADDDPSIRRLLRFVLGQRHTVIPATDGSAALKLLRQSRPDVVTLDGSMPGLDGLQVCRRIRADADLRRIGVIIVSGSVSADDARQAGADYFIAKPFQPSVLLATVDELLQAGNARP